MVKGQVEWGRCSRTVWSYYHNPPLVWWEDIIATCSGSHNIILLDAITGTPTSAFSGHTDYIQSLVFSLDGAFLVSGGNDRTVKLWDIQTGGVVKTFCGHTSTVCSTSISPNCTTIASGSYDCTIRLWDVQTWACHCIIEHSSAVKSVSFFPKNPKILMSACNNNAIQQWNINGNQIGPSYEGDHVNPSPDGSYTVSWTLLGIIATVWDFDTGMVVTKVQVPSHGFQCCCFSPNGKLLASSTLHAAYIWDLTNSDPHLIKTFNENGHFRTIAFSSSCIFSRSGESIKFWPIGTSSVDSVATESESTQLTSASILYITLQAKEGAAISIDSAGVVGIWDISTGHCKSLICTTAGPKSSKDARLIDGKLIFVWHENNQTYIWSTVGKKCLHSIYPQYGFVPTSLRISEDGSKILLHDSKYVRALSTQTGKIVDKAGLKPLLSDEPNPIARIFTPGRDVATLPPSQLPKDLLPISLFNIPPYQGRPHLDFIGPSMITDTVTGEVFYRLPSKYEAPPAVQCDGQYLVARYKTGEVLILDFIHTIPSSQ